MRGEPVERVVEFPPKPRALRTPAVVAKAILVIVSREQDTFDHAMVTLMA